MKEPVVLPKESLNAVIQYLARRPWSEANDLLIALLKSQDLELYLSLPKVNSVEEKGA